MTSMNPLALAWARRQIEIATAREIRKLAAEIRDTQKAIRPLRKAAEEWRKARMRQDGPSGFVMVDR